MKHYLILLLYTTQIALIFGREPNSFLVLMCLIFEFGFIVIYFSIVKLLVSEVKITALMLLFIGGIFGFMFYVQALDASIGLGDLPGKIWRDNLLLEFFLIYRNELIPTAAFIALAMGSDIRKVDKKSHYVHAQRELFIQIFLVMGVGAMGLAVMEYLPEQKKFAVTLIVVSRIVLELAAKHRRRLYGFLSR